MTRLFVAVPLPPSLRMSLSQLRSGIPGARWVEPEMLHLTLRFIGEVDGAAEEDVHVALADIEAEPFEVTLAGVGQFGDKKPHTLWAGVKAGEKLVRLVSKIEQALQRAGFPPETRRYTPHVTLARLRDVKPARVASFLTAHGLFQATPFLVTQFTLFSSFLSRNGALYRAEADFPLGTS